MSWKDFFNSPLWGVVLASFVQAIATLFNYWKEVGDWRRKDKSEQTSWHRDQAKNDELALRAAFQKAVHSLSIVVAEDDGEDGYSPDRTILAEGINGVALLVLRFADSELISAFTYFRHSPRKHSAEGLLHEIIRLARTDEALATFIKPTVATPAIEKAKHCIVVTFDDGYRKQRFIEGVVLPGRHVVRFSVTDIGESERALLVECLPEIVHGLNNQYQLPFPKSNENKHGQWRAKIDPGSARDILKSWADDYRAAKSVQN